MKVFEAIRVLDRNGRFAPKVLDADGADCHIGDAVWWVRNGTGNFRIVRIEPDGKCAIHDDDHDEPCGMTVPSTELTHKRPVLDADGAEVEVGDDLYSVEGSLKFHVSAIDRANGKIATDAMFAIDKWADPSLFTHQRPVLDADGVEIREGDTVWHVHDLDKFTVTNPNNGENLSVSCKGEDGNEYCCYPRGLTHRAPVLATDGKPLREGEHVYHVETGTELVVKRLPKPGEYQAVVVFALPASPTSHLTSFDPDRLTHERPDSWERLEEDAAKNPFDYCKDVGHRLDTCENAEAYKARDLVRRAKKLAERGQ